MNNKIKRIKLNKSNVEEVEISRPSSGIKYEEDLRNDNSLL